MNAGLHKLRSGLIDGKHLFKVFGIVIVREGSTDGR
jgi:hypothetical protein